MNHEHKMTIHTCERRSRSGNSSNMVMVPVCFLGMHMCSHLFRTLPKQPRFLVYGNPTHAGTNLTEVRTSNHSYTQVNMLSANYDIRWVIRSAAIDTLRLGTDKVYLWLYILKELAVCLCLLSRVLITFEAAA